MNAPGLPGPSQPEPLVESLLVVGVGLIGGSFAAGLRKAGRVRRVSGAGRGEANLRRALELGVIDEVATDLAQAAARADLILVAVPVAFTGQVLAGLLPGLHPGCVVTDAGSTKVTVIEQARAALGDAVDCFVPAHPIAGAELSGVDAASVGLYEGRRVVLTPLAENTPAAIARVEGAWRACGAEVSCMDAARHDEVLGLVSHLPHALAFALVDMIGTSSGARELFAFAGAGFRDFTRIAGSSPEMWRDILDSNRTEVRNGIRRFQQHLDQVAAMLDAEDLSGLEALFGRARDARTRYLPGEAKRPGNLQG